MKILRVFIFILFCVPCFALETQLMPEWYYFQKSLEAFKANNSGEAIRQLKNLVDNYGESAETLHLWARIYEEEGELDLAERYYLESLERSGFRVPDEHYTVRYRLAAMYYQRRNYKRYEDVLQEILTNQSMFTDARYARQRDAYISTLLTQGFDSFALLYRIPFDFAQEAHSGLGILYCRMGRDRNALLHLAFSNLALVTVLTEELRRRDPGYTYTTLEDLLQRASARPELADLMQRTGFFRSLYFLSALFAQGATREARRVWSAAAEYATGEWRNRSASQLIEPRTEPLITY